MGNAVDNQEGGYSKGWVKDEPSAYIEIYSLDSYVTLFLHIYI